MARLNATEWIWHDGEFIAWDDAQLHLLSHSMQFGSAIFEGVRAYSTPDGPAIFRFGDHLRRMMSSCRIYRMDISYTIDQLTDAACELVRRNKIDACYIRPMVLRGYGAAGMVPFDSPIEVYIPCWPWGAYLGDHAMEQGIDACVSSWNRVAPNTIPAAAKVAGNYLGGQLIKMEALANGFDEAIALGPGGMISEGSGQNVFLVHDGTLYTPPVDGTLLIGITRATVLTLARDAGMPVLEQPLSREMLYMAQEVFLCGTATEIAPVKSVDRIVVGDGKRGPVTRQLQQQYLDIATGKAPDPHGWLTHVNAGTKGSSKRG